jgi:protein-disulfide isomerase
MTRGVAFSLALLSFVLTSACAAPRLPSVIQSELTRTPQGNVTVIEFVDYECPFCRAMDRELSAALRQHQGRVRVVRKHVPLRRHVHARDAARAQICAEQAGKGDAMHAALMQAPSLDPSSLLTLAREVGLDGSALERCMKSRGTDARISADVNDFDDVHAAGVPTVFINRRRFEGVYPSSDLEEAIRAEIVP